MLVISDNSVIQAVIIKNKQEKSTLKKCKLHPKNAKLYNHYIKFWNLNKICTKKNYKCYIVVRMWIQVGSTAWFGI